jgi:TonB family protein
MNPIPNLILTNIFILLVYLVYRVAFSRSRFFQANRVVLLAGTAAALVLPWISPVMDFLRPSAEVQWLPPLPAPVNDYVPASPATLSDPVSTFSAGQMAIWAYLSTTAVLALIYLTSWARLLHAARNAPRHRHGRLKIFVIDRNWSTFSFFHTVFYPEPFDPDSAETRLILEHELVHARQLHTLDNILVGAVRILFFYNPCIYLLHKELMITHEFLADRLTSGIDRTGYSRILISHQFKVPHFVLMHPFNKQSFLKRRLFMLSKNTQSRLAGWKYLLVLPLFGGMILGSSWSASAQDQNQKKQKQLADKVEKRLVRLGFTQSGDHAWTKDGITVMTMDSASREQINALLKAAEEEKAWQETDISDQVFLIVEDMPTFQGGTIENFRKWVQQNIKYPKEAIEKHITGTVYVSFIVNPEGKAVKANILRRINPLLDDEVLRVINSSPDWTPGKQRGKLVNVSFSIPVMFVLEGTDKKKEEVTMEYVGKNYENKQVFIIVEEMPEFQGGGVKKFAAWAQDNVKYPQEAMEKSLTGTVQVSFIVNEDGKVVDAEISQSANPILDEAALNVVRSSPDWIPGKQRDHAVKVGFKIPIRFTRQ